MKEGEFCSYSLRILMSRIQMKMEVLDIFEVLWAFSRYFNIG